MPKKDDLDEQARKLQRMLLGEDDEQTGTRPRPSTYSKAKARWSTTGTAYTPDDPNEPEHPVLVECGRWLTAIEQHNVVGSELAAQNLYLLLQGMSGRPTIANALDFFRKHQPDSAENVPYINAVAAFVKQSQ